MKQSVRCTKRQKATVCPASLEVDRALATSQSPSLPERVRILVMYTGACWLDTLAGTLAIQGMGNQQGGAGGYCMVRYKPETSPEAETSTSPPRPNQSCSSGGDCL